MRKMKMLGFLIAALACSVTLCLAGPSAKSYQVTGKITELTDAKIVVEKADGEKWEVDRAADTKSEGEFKVGDKVTIMYTMTAKTIKAKGEAAAEEKTEKKSKK